MDERSWRLPGPSAWLQQAVDGLSSGIVVLEVPGSRSGGVAEAFERVAIETGFASSGFIRLGEAHLGLPPASAVLEAALPPDCQPPSASPVTIASNSDMDGIVVWVELKSEAWRRWSVFAGSFLAARAVSKLMDPPSIVILAPTGAGQLDPRVKLFRFEGQVGRDDSSLVFAESRKRGQRLRLERVLGVELAVEMAGWDLDLVKELAGLGLEDLMDPIAWADGRYANGPKEGSWAAGTLDRFDDRSFPSFATLLATGNTTEIRRRVWRAQVRGLFPWLEDLRQSALEKYRGKFRLPLRSYDDSVITDPAALDWGQMQYSLRGRVDRDEMDFLELMKRVRNRLAHRDPITYLELSEADRLARLHLGQSVLG